MRWKAGALLVGAALLVTGLSSWVARRTDARDDRRQALELEASVGAVRIDAAVNRAATTLAFAGDEVDVARLADAIGTPVCRSGVHSECARPDGSSSDRSAEAFDEPITERAVRMAAAASRDSGRPRAAVVADSPSTGGAIVVVARHPESETVALLPVEPGLVVLGATAPSDDRAVSATLATDFVNGTWSTRAVSDEDVGAMAGLTWATAVQVVAGALTTIAAISAMTRDQRGLHRRATIDALTGLPNRAEFERRAASRLIQLGREGNGACLIVVDLEGFKAINDSAGHAAGDRVLAEAGRRLAAAVRSTDLVGRWGGDEFVLLLAGVSDPIAIPDRTAAIAACLQGLSADQGTRLTASVGAAAFPLQGRDLDTLLGLADRAMYDTKPRAAPVLPWRP